MKGNIDELIAWLQSVTVNEQSVHDIISTFDMGCNTLVFALDNMSRRGMESAGAKIELVLKVLWL